MQITILSPEEYVTTNWSGGKTTQLFIYPSSAEYVKRDFSLRVSLASVCEETSTFTNLKGFDRILMSLDKSIELIHNNNQKICVQPFQIHMFSGNDKTVSRGICKDFNVMLKKNAYQNVELYALENEYNIIKNKTAEYFIYVYNGQYSLQNSNSILTVPHKYFIHLKNDVHVHINSKIANSKAIVLKLNNKCNVG